MKCPLLTGNGNLVFLLWLAYIGSCSCQVNPGNFDACEDLLPYIQQMQTMTPAEVFHTITLPISQTNYAAEFEDTKQTLLYLIQNNELQIDGFIQKLSKLTYLSKYDIMITTLVYIYNHLPKDWPLKEQLGQHLIKLVAVKYNYYADQNVAANYRSGFFHPFFHYDEKLFAHPTLSSMYPSTVVTHSTLSSVTQSTHSSKCETKPLLEIFKGNLVRQQPNTVSGQNLQNVRNTLLDLLKLIPKPQDQYETAMYNIIADLFKSESVVKLFSSFDFSKYKDKAHILDMVIDIMRQNLKNDRVQEAMRFYSFYKEANNAGFLYANLAHVIPLPTTPDEERFYIALKDLLESREIYTYLKNFTVPKTDMQTIFVNVLDKLASLDIFSTALYKSINYSYAKILAQQTGYNYDKLLNLLPQPINQQDHLQYNIFKQFLDSKDPYILMKDVQPSNMKDRDLLNLLLERIITRKQNSPTLVQISKQIKRHLINNNYAFNYLDLLSLLPKPHNDKEKATFKLIENYFYSADIDSIWPQINLPACSNRTEIFQAIFKTIQKSTTDKELKDSVSFYLDWQRRLKFLGKLDGPIKLLPLPNTPEETNYYNVLFPFLQSDDGFSYLANMDTAGVKDDRNLLLLMLKTLVQGKAPNGVTKAAQFYLDQFEQLAPIELITTKQITKSFNLTKIFRNVFDKGSMGFEQYNVFRKLFVYIANNQQLIGQFTQWDQAKTCGQFVKMLFQFLLAHKEVPDAIKSYIRVLEPLIQMDGKAALPP